MSDAATTPASTTSASASATDAAKSGGDNANANSNANANANANANTNAGEKKERTIKRAEVKVVKGMADWLPEEMVLRERIFDTVRSVFRRHGAVTIQTPIVELKTTLTGKYGEDTKLIYDLADQGGEISALRYDLTVPFARYVATHGVKSIKRYQIGQVYRRDQPAAGRYREFFQCDFDIAGEYDPMMPDAECIAVLQEALEDLGLPQFIVKVNHRRLLDAMFQASGVAAADFAVVCSSVDKLDKLSPADVKKELCERKGQPPAVIDRVLALIAAGARDKSPDAVLQLLESSAEFAEARDGAATKLACAQAIGDLRLLLQYLRAYGRADGRVVFDLSLARGLDYYTGVIFEAVLTGAAVGSVSGGGRYDDLVGMFAGRSVPSVGFSLGVERIYTVLDGLEKLKKINRRANHTQVYVCAHGEHLTEERLRLCAELWRKGVAAETTPKVVGKLLPQLKKAGEGTPMAVIVGDDEIKAGIVKVKWLQLAQRKDLDVPRVGFADAVAQLLANPPADVVAAAVAAPTPATESTTASSSSTN